MKLEDIKDRINEHVYNILADEGIDELRPSQEKAINAGLLEQKSLLVCTPTASGKTLIAELASTDSIAKGHGKAIYIVPLKALATEKYKDFKRKYGKHFRIALSIGELDEDGSSLSNSDWIICTAEKLDSLIRHNSPWINYVKTVVIDEIHLLNDPSRGPTLEILITLLRQMLKDVQIIGLSATIGNPSELSEWLDSELVMDTWRPIVLKEGVYWDGKIEFKARKG